MSDSTSSPTASQTRTWEEYLTARQVLASIEMDGNVASAVKMSAGLKVAAAWNAFLRTVPDTSAESPEPKPSEWAIKEAATFTYAALHILDLSEILEEKPNDEIGRFQGALARTFLRGLEDRLHPLVRESIR